MFLGVDFGTQAAAACHPSLQGSILDSSGVTLPWVQWWGDHCLSGSSPYPSLQDFIQASGRLPLRHSLSSFQGQVLELLTSHATRVFDSVTL